MPPEYSPTDYAMLGRSGLSSADIAGLTGQSLRLNWPMAGAALLSVIPSIYQSYEQGKEFAAYFVNSADFSSMK